MNRTYLHGKMYIAAALLLALLLPGPFAAAARPTIDCLTPGRPDVLSPTQTRDGTTASTQDIRIVLETEPSAANALSRLQAGELDAYAHYTTDPELLQQIEDSPESDGYRSYVRYRELTFNPAGPVFSGTGKLNPFAVPRVRKAMNYLIDRTYVTEEIMGGLGAPRWLPFDNASNDYALMAAEARAIELKYAYSPELAEEIISEEMEALGATLDGGVWQYEGVPVEISILIRTEDERIDIGDYVGSQLEEIGFTVIRDYKTAAEASPIWVSGNPEDGLYHIYTGGWITTVVPRNLAGNFAFFYTDMGLALPLWQAFENDPEFYEIADRLDRSDFTTLEERRDMMVRALELAMEDSHRIWLADRQGITPRRAEVSYASDLYGGMTGSWLWAQTLQRNDSPDAALAIGTPSTLNEPWNPLGGTNWIHDLMPIRATGEMGHMPDPHTGLWWPRRFERAEVTVEEGLPVFQTLDWVDLEFVNEIVVPDDAWVDWDPVEQRFLTAGEVYTQPETVAHKSTVYYPADLFATVSWHDGSPLSLGDFVMAMIMRFDRAKEASPYYDYTQVPRFNSFMASFRGMRIVSEDPLIIEHYSNHYEVDAERSITSWFPYYSQGPGAWHNLALGLMAEADGEAAFSAAKSDVAQVPWLNYIGEPSLTILADQLTTAKLVDYIPYAPTLEDYVAPGQAVERWNNLEQWYTEHGHFWIGTGPFYLEQFSAHGGELTLRSYPDHPDPQDRWDGFRGSPPIADVLVDGPETFERGEEIVYTVEITLDEEPYPDVDIEAVRYLVLDSDRRLRLSGDATPLVKPSGDDRVFGTAATGEGIWQVTLDAQITHRLPPGGGLLEVAVTPKRVVIPSFGGQSFTAPDMEIYLPLVLRDHVRYFEGPWEMEPNNTWQQANGPLISGRDYYGYPNDEKDYFSIYVQRGGEITVTLTGHTGQHVQLQLFDGRPKPDSSNVVAYAKEKPYELTHDGDPGWYYIYINTGAGYNSHTRYTLRVTYPRYFEGPWEEEPNDRWWQANGPLTSGRGYYGYPNDERDFFSIYTRKPGQITVNLTGHTGQGVQLQLFRGPPLADGSNRVGFVAQSPYQITHNGPAGWYYIYIYTESGHNEHTPYTLRVTYPE